MDIGLLLEAERRGLLSPEQAGLLAEARRRGLVSPAEGPQGLPATAGARSVGPHTQGTTPEQAAAARQELGASLGDMAVGAGEGLTFGFGDELMGAYNAMGAARYGAPIGEAYATGRDNARARQDLAHERSPIAAGVGNVGGAVLPAIAATPLAIGKTVLGTAGRGIALGATEGSLFGLGSGEGTSDRLLQMLKGAGIGAVAGAAAPAIGAGIRYLPRMARGAVDAVTGLPNAARAERAVGRMISRSGRSADDIAADIHRAALEGQPMFTAADAMGISGQRGLAGVARTPGAGRTEITDYLNSRQANQGDRTSAFLADALGGTDTVSQREAALAAQRSADAGVNYPAAREGADAVDVRPAVSLINERLRPMSNSAGITGGGLDSRLAGYRARLSGSDAGGPVDLSDFSRVLEVKQDIGDAIGEAVRAGRGNEARLLTNIQNALDASLEKSSAGYRTANDTYRAQSQVIDALGQGSDAARSSVRAADTIDTFSALTPDQQAAFRLGYSDPLQARIASQRPGANRVGPLLTDKSQAELSAIANDPNLLADRLLRENTMFETRRQAIGGSQTADNMNDIKDLSPLDFGLIANLLSGRVGTAATQAGQKASNALIGQNEATRALIARMLLSGNPGTSIAPAAARTGQEILRARLLDALLRQAGATSGRALATPQ